MFPVVSMVTFVFLGTSTVSAVPYAYIVICSVGEVSPLFCTGILPITKNVLSQPRP